MVRRFPDAGVASVVCGSSNSLRRVARAAPSLLRSASACPPRKKRGEHLPRLIFAAVVAVYDAVYAVGQVGWRYRSHRQFSADDYQ